MRKRIDSSNSLKYEIMALVSWKSHTLLANIDSKIAKDISPNFFAEIVI